MAYDEALAGRIRALLSDEPEVSERKMFGGIAFMAPQGMFCGVVRDELMARIGDEAYDAALAREGVRPMDFAGPDRVMRGMVFVDAAATRTDASLGEWVEQALTYTRANPTKNSQRRGRKP